MKSSLVCLCCLLTMLSCAAQQFRDRSDRVKFGHLPQGICSFGAVEMDGFAYVYSGQTGNPAALSRDGMMVQFLRMNLLQGGDWEVLPMERPAQEVALVTDRRRLYRIGGMHAVNEPGDAAELYSIRDFSAFDPCSNCWQPMPELPEPRSSHRAAVLGEKLYVFGGWTLNGEEDGQWLKHGLVFDLNRPNDHWLMVNQPVPCRAMEVVAFAEQIWLLGGLFPDGACTSDVYVYRPATGSWCRGPTLPGSRLNGSSLAAAVMIETEPNARLKESLLVSLPDGDVYKLTETQDRWEPVATVAPARSSHRLIALPGRLYAIGGATRLGHLTTIDKFQIDVTGQCEGM